MWKIRKFADAGCIVLSISGRIKAEELRELQNAILSEDTPPQNMHLDLENLRLVDLHVVSYFAQCESNGTQLRNCPSYIRDWIDREKAAQNQNTEPGPTQ